MGGSLRNPASFCDVARAEKQRVDMAARTHSFFDEHDLLLCPLTIVTAFPIGERYLLSATSKVRDYINWLAMAYAITLVCCPALSLPCGFMGESSEWTIML